MAPRKRPLEDRFWEKVQRSPTCWLWTGAKNRQGYGVITEDGRSRPAHRVSWELHEGPIPEGLYVCHHCDVPACVRPEHLFVGRPCDNSQDMMDKGREASQAGSRHILLRTSPMLHDKLKEIARRSNVSINTMINTLLAGAIDE